MKLNDFNKARDIIEELRQLDRAITTIQSGKESIISIIEYYQRYIDTNISNKLKEDVLASFIKKHLEFGKELEKL